MKYYSATRKNEKNESFPFAATWMDLKGIMLNEINQTKRQILYIIAYKWNLQIKQASNYNKKKNKRTHRYREQSSVYL